MSEQQSVTRQKDAAKNESIRVPANKLDALINLLGELVINQARLSEIARTWAMPFLRRRWKKVPG